MNIYPTVSSPDKGLCRVISFVAEFLLIHTTIKINLKRDINILLLYKPRIRLLLTNTSVVDICLF